MALTSYDYPIADADLDELEPEITAAGVPGLQYSRFCIDFDADPAVDGIVTVWTDPVLSIPDEVILANAVAAHVPTTSTAARVAAAGID